MKLLNYLLTLKGQRNALIILLVLIVLCLRNCNSINHNLEQNIEALTDSVRTYKDRNGVLVYEKTAFIASEKELKKLNVELSNEVKYLKDHPIVVIKSKNIITHDTVHINVGAGSQYTDQGKVIASFPWSFDTTYSPDNFRTLEGVYTVEVDTEFCVKTTMFTITKDRLGISFVTGLTETKDNKLEIFIKSSYPDFKTTDINGALIDPEKSDVLKKLFPPKRWSVGPFIGYGAYFDPVQSKFGTGVTLGISVTYGVFQWKDKK